MMTSMDIPLSRQLGRFVSGRVCVLGIGNRQRRDDGAGSLIAARLTARTTAPVIDAGAVPENYVERVARLDPDTVLIVDAADFGGDAGEARLLGIDAIMPAGLSTHALSLATTAAYLGARTGARVAVLAIQPADLGWGTGLSPRVSQAVAEVEAALWAALEERSTMAGPGGAPGRAAGGGP